jgi:hypothetical protein
MTSMTYPVHVDARLDSRVSRGLWLVKWLLALPHYIVLAFLWIAFVVLSVIAFFAILFTGRYPRSIFDFNVGVLRWHWRVAYYAYGALGTDRYPPFTLRDVPDYPAHLEVDYPAELSRGLVLVKWWLLALPHYLVVGLLVGGAGYAVGASDDRSGLWATGLIPLLVLVAGLAVLFTGRYPQPLFDLVLGLNRWVLRVAGYAALMTDTYPPFRLDQGGPDAGMHRSGPAPGHAPVVDRPAGGAPLPPAPDGRSGSAWTTGRIVSLVAGCVLALGAVGFAVPAAALVVADQTARDDAGFLMTPTETYTSQTYAIVSEDLEMHADTPPDLTPDAFLGDTRITADAAGGDEVFVGLGPAADVRGFLAQVEHATVVDVVDGEPVMRTADGGAPAEPPASADFWVAQASGPGPQEITWSPENGDWAVLVMNADATAGVDVAVRVGAEVPALPWAIGILLGLSGALLLLAVPLVAVPLRAVSRESRTPAA